MGNSFHDLCWSLFAVAAAPVGLWVTPWRYPSNPQAGFMEPSFGVDDTEFDRPIVDAPSAAGLLQQTDRLAGQHFADEDQPATPFDFAAAAHPAATATDPKRTWG